MRRLLCAIAISLAGTTAGSAELTEIHYLRVAVPRPPTLSALDLPPPDLGRAGADLAIEDNRTTGRFLGHDYVLTTSELPVDGDIAAAAQDALTQTSILVLDAPVQALHQIADLPEAADALLFNVSSPDAELRGAGCRANLLHTLPSTQMRTDALAQFLVSRNLSDFPLIAGGHPSDQAFADSLEHSLVKYGLRPGPRKEWRFDADIRRAASAEIPLFTQEFGRYDILLVADEIGDFARYVPYNTWQPRPVAGSEGLVPVGWDRTVEQWGAVQLQNRFAEAAERPMEPLDFAAWAAIRSIGEAVTRTGANDASTLRAYILGTEFELDGFLGRRLTFRDWNGQLRQPIPLVHANALVAQAPIEGFLHPVSELDTIGLDRPESDCTAFAE